MKFKILFLILLTFNIFISNSQTENRSIQINWGGIEKWSIGSSHINVLSFENAHYPTDSHLPYYHLSLPITNSETYHIELKNQTYIPVSENEARLIPTGFNSTVEEIQKHIVDDRSQKKMEVEILPFISKDGKLLKINTFDISITKSVSQQKTSKANNRTYASNSVLASGRFVKIKIVESGVYKLTYDDINAMGVNSANVRIFGYGGAVLDQNFQNPKIDDLPEVAIYMNKGSDGVFNSGDYILFYGQGINKWSFDKYKNMFTHAINPYSKYGYYFVTSDAGTGKRIAESSINIPSDAVINPITEFTDYQVHEKENISIIESGREFYGETFNDVSAYSFSFSTPNAISSKVRLDVVSSIPLEKNSTTFTTTLNGGQPNTLTHGPTSGNADTYTFGLSGSGIYSFSNPGDNSVYKITYSRTSSSCIGYLNFLEVNTRRQLKMSGNYMQFQNTDYIDNDSYNRYFLSNATSNIEIWDITDQQNIVKIPTQYNNGIMTFEAPGNEVRRYIALDPTAKNSFSSPSVDGAIANQNLHAITQADLIIITNPRFTTQAQELAKIHQEKDNLSAAVVTTEQVYNEFSSGTPDATAYRWVSKMLYDRALESGDSNNLPKYLLLFGRGTFDNRKLLNSSGDNLTLTYQTENSLITTASWVTDDYFGLLDDNDGTSLYYNNMDLGVGRFPVTTTTQADNVVEKIRSYLDNDLKGSWKNQLCFVADDGDQSTHAKDADSVAVAVSKTFPAYQINKIYLDAFQQEKSASGESYPLVKTKLSNMLTSGALLVNYNGHAGATGWTNEGILTTNDVKSFSNNKLPLFYGATCDFLQFDIASVSGGEHILLNPTGGGIGMISAARPVFAGPNRVLDQAFCTTLFKKDSDGKHMSIGDALMKAKNMIGNDNGNKLSYILMGDPALTLKFPTDYQIVTSEINGNTTLSKDTLKAMSVATIKGYIADAKGNKIDNFNGSLHASVYDKIQRITTFNNDGDGAMTYYDRPSMLFSGNAEVKNGEFSITFMLPKDIKYNYGSGRIDYYAQDDTENKEAQGCYEKIIIGGTDKNIAIENEGPTMSLYLNTDKFVSGDKVNESPLFLATLSDPHGINTVGGSGIGHDITLTIDDDPATTYILNDYYTAFSNSYTNGNLRYKMPSMTNGKHTLTLRAWDLLNNSSTQSIDFEVVQGLTPTIFSAVCYPNPASVSSATEFVITHDRPETVLSTVVEIFDLTGRKIWSFSQSSTDKIRWDLTGQDGLKVNTGMYLYRISIKTKNSDLTSKSNKIIISQ